MGESDTITEINTIVLTKLSLQNNWSNGPFRLIEL